MASNEERRYQYYVPDNFTNGARLFGFLRTRNAVELVIGAGGLAFFEISFLNLGLKWMVVLLCATVIPVAVLLAVGIDGCSFTEYLQRIFKSYTERKYIVKREAHYGVEAEAQYARTTCKRRKRNTRKRAKQ